ncbi:MAG: patatin-like phospholipase family protein [Kangiellaceae bacterium]|nr:patatin-like phospholipase family protein [Kangiellaceae bacterium]
MSSSISIFAGKKALKEIQRHGLSQQQIKVVAGASGGPKWFTLFGLDKYLFGEFFKNRQETLHTIGSSAGSWRLACMAQKDPVAAIERLAHLYSNEQYSEKPTVDEISDKAAVLLNRVLGETGAAEIANHKTIQSHFIVARAKGLNSSENKFAQLMGLIGAASLNAISKQSLEFFFERFLFYTDFPSNQSKLDHDHSHYFKYKDSNTQYIRLSADNVHQTLMASGAIPMVLRGIKDIAGSAPGVYRDGGIIDYHLDIDFGEQGLVLYPHFFPTIKPGWFDKKLGYRSANPKNFENVILVTPSSEHVSRLPFGKISDRSDFTKLDTTTRINYWKTVLMESERLADDFSNLIENRIGLETVKPIESIL